MGTVALNLALLELCDVAAILSLFFKGNSVAVESRECFLLSPFQGAECGPNISLLQDKNMNY